MVLKKVTMQRWSALWCLVALMLALSGCATKFAVQQDLMVYTPNIDAEEYPVAFDVNYSNPFPGQESLAIIERKLLSSPDVHSPYVIELQYRQFIKNYWIDMRVWSAGEVVLEEAIHARQRGAGIANPELHPEPLTEFYKASADHFAQYINDRVRADYPRYYEALMADSESALRAFLSDNRESLLYYAALSALGHHAPPGDQAMAWHLANKKQYPGYVTAQPNELRLWLTGPADLSFWELQKALSEGGNSEELLAQVLEARAFDLPPVTHNERYGSFDFEAYLGGAIYSPVMDKSTWDDARDYNTNWRDYIHTNLANQYRFQHQFTGIGIQLTEQQRQSLQQRGLSEHLIAAADLGDEGYGEHFAQWRYERLNPEQYIHGLRLDHSSGRYLSPYTEDDVVAEWVNRAINARIGATIGSTAGAVAGAQLGRNIPVPGGQFIGGMIGSAAGQSAGRDAAIQAVGGWGFIQETSDYSFASVRDMAEYLLYHFGDRDDFMDVISAASAVYPGLGREVNAMVR